ncbi:MAG: CRTAC1 family protein [Candidatus Brocadiia bacterium]
MSPRLLPALLLLCASLGCGAASEPGGQGALRFVEAAAPWGLAEPLAGIMAHAAACGDIDGDGDLDLYVGGFCDRLPQRYRPAPGPVPNVLLINEAGRFRDSGQDAVVMEARTSGAVFADLDNDGDLDLVVTNNSKRRGLRVANKLFENAGGRFRDVSQGNPLCVTMGGRSIGVLDFDGDGLLDLLVTEDKWTGRHTRLYRNKGDLQFEDVTAKAGLPADLPGLGVITPDLNLDGWPDIFVSQANRLFLSQGDGTYREGGSQAFHYEPINREASPCGVACGDLDRDGDLDIVVVDHSQPARQHLFLNEGLRDGVPRFREVTAQAGLAYEFPSWTPDRFHLKHAHVEIGDLDNDGWPDIAVAATWLDGTMSRPFVCRNLGLHGGQLRFHVPPVRRGNAYFACGPVGDFDRDGRLDLFMAGSVAQMPSRLFLNRTPPRHWVRVRVLGRTINRMGIGAKVRVYRAGGLGEPRALLGYSEIGTGQGYCTGQEAIAHFGLGHLTVCDVLVTLPFGKGTVRRPGVPADRLLTVAEP